MWKILTHSKSPSCFQNVVLLSLLVVVRGQSSPEEQCVLSATRIVTQLWLRMSPDQVRYKYIYLHKGVMQMHDCYYISLSLQVQTQPVLQCTLQLLLSMSAILVKNFEPQVISQVGSCAVAVHMKHMDNRPVDYSVCVCVHVSGSGVCGCLGVSEVSRSAASSCSGVPLLPGEDFFPS